MAGQEQVHLQAIPFKLDTNKGLMDKSHIEVDNILAHCPYNGRMFADDGERLADPLVSE